MGRAYRAIDELRTEPGDKYAIFDMTDLRTAIIDTGS